MTLKGKRLLILGGVRLAIEIVKAAQNLGAYVIVTDYIEDSPAKKYANKSFMVSVTDIDAVVDLIKQEKIDGVLTGFVDSLLPYYSMICDKAGLPCYGTLEQFEIATHKAKFKERCRAFDIPVVKEYHVNYPFENEDLKNIQYPVLIKPVDNSGARGIFICNDEVELKKKYPLALTFSKSKNILVEKYINAKEATVNYLIQDGEIIFSVMADRHVKNKQSGIVPLPVGYIFPSIHQKRYQDNIDEKVKMMFKALGIKNGIIFIQCFIEDENCIFYEMGYRLTGPLEFKIINEINGINPIELLINFALTGKMSVKKLNDIIDPNYKRYGFNLTFIVKPGQIKKIIGVEDVRAIANVIDVVVAHDEGEIILEDDIGTLKQVVVRVLGFAQDKEELRNVINNIVSLINVYSADDEPMLLEVFDTNDL